MEFIKIAYCISIPLLLMTSWLSRLEWKKYALNVMAVTNILLIGNSFFLLWQLIGIYLLGKQFNTNDTFYFSFMNIQFIRLLLMIISPFLSLIPSFRRNTGFSLFLMILLYWNFPFSSWNTYDLLFKIPGYLCLLCSAYAMAWLLNKLPFQSFNS